MVLVLIWATMVTFSVEVAGVLPSFGIKRVTLQTGSEDGMLVWALMWLYFSSQTRIIVRRWWTALFGTKHPLLCTFRDGESMCPMLHIWIFWSGSAIYPFKFKLKALIQSHVQFNLQWKSRQRCHMARTRTKKKSLVNASTNILARSGPTRNKRAR
jgi:hypothetical protein